MGFHVLMVAIIVFHFLVLGYLVVGGFIAMKWPRTIWAHLAMAVWGTMIVTVPGLVCPLTWSENWAREHAGVATYSGGFIDRYIENVLYPGRLTPYVQSLIALVVLCSWIALFVRRRRSVTTRSAEPAERM